MSITVQSSPQPVAMTIVTTEMTYTQHSLLLSGSVRKQRQLPASLLPISFTSFSNYRNKILKEK